jgi:hypothetical protein
MGNCIEWCVFVTENLGGVCVQYSQNVLPMNQMSWIFWWDLLTKAPPPPLIPQGIADSAIEVLNTKAQLMQCATVSKSFLIRSRKRLFRDIASEKLQALLRDFPHSLLSACARF